ncbi:sarcosine oxidase subunit gamma family protein [Acidothermaceae bacterium B102]|nr:sarcosine oxidase subunit gamma family protein [Acidothermaceae bacterium B102]
MGDRMSPLAAHGAVLSSLPSSVEARELPFLTQLNVRLDPTGPAGAAVAALLGAGLPMSPCTAVIAGEYELLWLGPDEWLVVAPAGRSDELGASLRSAIGAERGAVTDVSAQRTAVVLRGPGARELLAKGCSIDLHPRVSPRGTCVQTLLAQTGVTLVVHDDTASDFLLLVRASFAVYLAGWLADAAVELTR